MNKRVFAVASVLAIMVASAASAQTYGPFNAVLPAGGDAVTSTIGDAGAAAINAPAWTLSGWVEPKAIANGIVLIAGFGDPATGPRRFLALDGGRPGIITETGALTATTRLAAGKWRFVAATCDGSVLRLFVDGRQVAQRTMAVAAVRPTVVIAPRRPP
jgi:hypothetical protein